MRRPVSVQHNKPHFGEFYMTKKNDIIPKVCNYRVDGSGKDSYINFNNGGNKATSNELGSFKYANKKGTSFYNSGKIYNVIPKVTIYKTDGMGRDQYIVRDCGGVYQCASKLNPFTFKTTLRSYDSKPTKVVFNDFSILSKNHVIKPVKERMVEETKKQRVLSARLSVPKYINVAKSQEF